MNVFRLSNARKKWNEAGKDVVVLHMVMIPIGLPVLLI
jgi:hypothetical protein